MRYQDYLEVSASTDVEHFERRLVRFVGDMGFGLVSAALVVDAPGQAPRFAMIGNTPEAFFDSSRSAMDSKRDPVLRRLRNATVPFVYDQALYVAEGAADLWEEQAAHGYQTGISMALHMPEGRHFLLGVDRAEALPQSVDELTRLMADLQLLAVYAQDTAVRLLLTGPSPSVQPVRLTPREREVLVWTREGKSAWAVGQILAMSEHTVNYHLRNVMRKMDVSSKHLAILRAQAMGLL
jgi:DNA-binding CsgD family transcriptional regulator